ncbi:MAG: helix-turn-helix transcriptional regulator [Spirochaetales bacterium]|nr:helix-turn-helix transcriptional regulator [Spirochaetales bacterium]
MASLQDIFVTNLKRIRNEKHISQMELAEMCDKSQALIGVIEAKRSLPSFETIEAIAAALQVSVYELFLPTDENDVTDENIQAIVQRLDKELNAVKNHLQM